MFGLLRCPVSHPLESGNFSPVTVRDYLCTSRPSEAWGRCQRHKVVHRLFLCCGLHSVTFWDPQRASHQDLLSQWNELGFGTTQFWNIHPSPWPSSSSSSPGTPSPQPQQWGLSLAARGWRKSWSRGHTTPRSGLGYIARSLGLTLWSFKIAIEHGPFIVDLPTKDCDFP